MTRYRRHWHTFELHTIARGYLPNTDAGINASRDELGAVWGPVYGHDTSSVPQKVMFLLRREMGVAEIEKDTPATTYENSHHMTCRPNHMTILSHHPPTLTPLAQPHPPYGNTTSTHSLCSTNPTVQPKSHHPLSITYKLHHTPPPTFQYTHTLTHTHHILHHTHQSPYSTLHHPHTPPTSTHSITPTLHHPHTLHHPYTLSPTSTYSTHTYTITHIHTLHHPHIHHHPHSLISHLIVGSRADQYASARGHCQTLPIPGVGYGRDLSRCAELGLLSELITSH